MQREFFAGALTPNGVYNLFNTITDGVYTYVLKGGSGSGKSTIIKRIAKHFDELGEEVEMFRCSLDADSFDGVRIAGRGIAVVDGTFPHVIEPAIIGVTGRYIDLTEYLGTGVLQHSDKIKELTKRKKETLNEIYRLYGEAKSTHLEIEAIMGEYMDYEKVQSKCDDIISLIEENVIA